MAVSLDQLAKPCVSSTLAANELINQMRTDGIDIAHMAFGQAPFPAPQRLVNALRDHAGEKGYMPIAGLPELRQAVRTADGYPGRLADADTHMGEL
jgi:aspartate/methionine/tyrosine aminotransferase